MKAHLPLFQDIFLRVRIVLFSLIIFSSQGLGQNWMLKGNEILGDSVYDLLGYSVDVSADGKTIVFGVHYSDLNGLDAGLVRVMHWVDTAWAQKGNDIYGINPGDNEGYYVAISADGGTIATASLKNDSVNNDAGQIRVFHWSGTAWQQRGNAMFGTAVYDAFGHSIKLNGDGTLVAAGSPNSSSGGYRAGLVKVYRWDGSVWNQMGVDILGESTENYSGFALSLSANDSIIAIGAYYNSGNGTNSGQVRVYEWTGTAWTQKGSDVDGAAAGDKFGVSVDITPDGNTFVSGAYDSDGTYSGSGSVRVFDWNGTTWAQRGTAIYGDWPDDNFGTSVSISADGNTIAGGAPPGQATNYNTPSPGYTKIFTWDTAWAQSGANLYGKLHGDQNGRSVSLSANGKLIVIGEPYSDPNMMSAAGRIRVYYTCDTSYIAFNETVCFSYELPSGKGIVTASGTYNDTIENSQGCDSIMTITVVVNTVDTVVVKSGITLTAQAQSATFQWLDCNNGYAEISGETSSTFTPTVNGNYAVEISQNGCVDTSGCFAITTVGFLENGFNQVAVFPNPTNGQLHISFLNSHFSGYVRVFNVLGEVIQEERLKNTHESKLEIKGSAGLYLLQIVNDYGERTVIKVYKN